MDHFEQQEARARTRVRWSAIAKSGFTAGLILFVMSGGGPWMTAGTMNCIMGRDVPAPFIVLLLAHFAVALGYAWVIAHAVYRWVTVWMAAAVGVLTGLGLYFVNFAFFRGLDIAQHSGEGRTIFVHLVFGVMAAVLYRAFAIPKSTWRGGGRPAH